MFNLFFTPIYFGRVHRYTCIAPQITIFHWEIGKIRVPQGLGWSWVQIPSGARIFPTSHGFHQQLISHISFSHLLIWWKVRKQKKVPRRQNVTKQELRTGETFDSDVLYFCTFAICVSFLLWHFMDLALWNLLPWLLGYLLFLLVYTLA